METTDIGEVPVDVYQKLANDRMLFINDYIDDQLATDIVATLMVKDSEDDSEKITLFINSGGGNIRNIFMIYDMMNLISAPIETVCLGSAMDEVALLLSSGTPGMRLATKNSVISVGQLIHDSMSYSDLTDAKSILDLSVSDNKRMMEILAKNTNTPLKKFMATFERTMFMNPSQAVKYGLIDKVVSINKKEAVSK
jgi:ATP-dependent Clp protease, protease subunit